MADKYRTKMKQETLRVKNFDADVRPIEVGDSLSPLHLSTTSAEYKLQATTPDELVTKSYLENQGIVRGGQYALANFRVTGDFDIGDLDDDWNIRTGGINIIGIDRRDADCYLSIISWDDFNPKIILAEGVIRHWVIGAKVDDGSCVWSQELDFSTPRMSLSSTGSLTIADDLYVGDNIFLTSDSATIYMGTDNDDYFIQANNNGVIFHCEDSGTNVNNDSLTIQTASAGTTAAGFGGAILLSNENGSGGMQEALRLGTSSVIVTGGSESTSFTVDLVSGGTMTERMVLDHSGNLTTDGKITMGTQGSDDADCVNVQYVQRKAHTAVWGCKLARTTGQDGSWLGIPTGAINTNVVIGTTAGAPDTSYAVSTTADDLGCVIWQGYHTIQVRNCRMWIGQGYTANTRHSVSLMRYDIDVDGDLSNGVEVGQADDANSDDYSQLRIIDLTISGTTANLVVESTQVLIGLVFMRDAANAAMSAKVILEYQEYEA